MSSFCLHVITPSPVQHEAKQTERGRLEFGNDDAGYCFSFYTRDSQAAAAAAALVVCSRTHRQVGPLHVVFAFLYLAAKLNGEN